MDRRGLPQKNRKATKEPTVNTPTQGKSTSPSAQQNPNPGPPNVVQKAAERDVKDLKLGQTKLKPQGTVQEILRKMLKQLDHVRRGRECTEELEVFMDQLRDIMPDISHDMGRIGPLKEGRTQAQVNLFWDKVRSQLSIDDEEIEGSKTDTEEDGDYPSCTWLGPAMHWEKRTKE